MTVYSDSEEVLEENSAPAVEGGGGQQAVDEGLALVTNGWKKGPAKTAKSRRKITSTSRELKQC